ncbi:hypothetical protein A2U01_0076569, partial [Trifolium medium]|nr:hypothetical protein [Trifolium medium]
MNKYRYGLRGDIAHAVSLQHVRDFIDLIQKAYSTEATIEYAKQEKEAVYQQRRIVAAKSCSLGEEELAGRAHAEV